MTDAVFDVLAVGHAIVDVIAHAGEAFIVEEGLAKGTMQLIDTGRANDLYGKMNPAIQTSGGCGANTAVGVASLGGKAAFIGCVADDNLGRVFRHDLTAAGVTAMLQTGGGLQATARCLILVTPDAERTMNTYLGAAAELGETAGDAAQYGIARVIYLEGFLFSTPSNKQLFLDAASAAKAAGRMVALSLSDRFCVEGHRDGFLAFIRDYVDILFANEPEITALYQTEEFAEAARRVSADVEIACLTRGAAGSVIVTGGLQIEVAAEKVAQVVDTTGAGDLYAAGFLYGHTNGMTPEQCARIGSIAAAEVIGHVGPRPQVSLAELAARANLRAA